MKKASAIILICLLIFSGVACGADSTATKTAKKKGSSKTVVKKTGAKTDSVKPKEIKLPKLVDLGADKCMPCKMMAPILDSLHANYSGRLEVVFIDVWKNSEEGQKYRIRVIPTQIFLSPEGKELYRHEGFYSLEDILKKWKELGYDLGQ